MATQEGAAHQAGELIAGPRFRSGDEYGVLSDFRARLSDDGAERVLDYWAGLVRANDLKIKHLIDPIDIPDLLPHIYIEEMDVASGQSRMRLVGDYLRNLSGFSLIGLIAEEHSTPEVLQLWLACDRLNFEEQVPTLCTYSLAHFEKEHHWVWDMSLPMSDLKGNRFTLGYLWSVQR